jgi:serine phosphatase RsbU (regulator of sigma subunit)
MDRLVHFLQREAASGLPPPETVRRLVRAVMAHQDDVLQDDATVLLARWDGSELSV